MTGRPGSRVAYRCVRGHESGGEGPPIPFDSPVQLHAVLAARPALAVGIASRLTAGDRSRMPLDEPLLTAGERDELLAYAQAWE